MGKGGFGPRTLSGLIEYIHAHVDMPDPRAYVALATWVMMIWVYEKFVLLPYLFFFGLPATGKTALGGSG